MSFLITFLAAMLAFSAVIAIHALDVYECDRMAREFVRAHL